MSAVVAVGDRQRVPGRGRGRGGVALVLVAVAGALLLAMTWSTLRVISFVETGTYCREQTCTVAALEESAVSGQASDDDLVIDGQEALWDAGVTPVEHYFAYQPLAGMAWLLVLALALVATGLRWSAARAGVGSAAVRPTLGAFVQSDLVVQVLAVAVGGFLLLYLGAWEQMSWFSWVTD